MKSAFFFCGFLETRLPWDLSIGHDQFVVTGGNNTEISPFLEEVRGHHKDVPVPVGWSHSSYYLLAIQEDSFGHLLDLALPLFTQISFFHRHEDSGFSISMCEISLKKKWFSKREMKFFTCCVSMILYFIHFDEFKATERTWQYKFSWWPRNYPNDLRSPLWGSYFSSRCIKWYLPAVSICVLCWWEFLLDEENIYIRNQIESSVTGQILDRCIRCISHCPLHFLIRWFTRPFLVKNYPSFWGPWGGVLDVHKNLRRLDHHGFLHQTKH